MAFVSYLYQLGVAVEVVRVVMAVCEEARQVRSISRRADVSTMMDVVMVMVRWCWRA